MQIPNTPPKWTADWFPEEYKVRKYIFDTWRQVCLSYGFEEYLGPLVESTKIWEAKSGEDVGGSELTQITDREGELSGLAIRPEMTPSVTRMVSRKWKEIEKPVKWFSIANYYRNEKPQKWRNREFWQLNADIFGEDSLNADLEILTLALDLMRAFNPPAWSYKLKLNHRKLIDAFLSEVLGISKSSTKTELMRLMDKYEKLKKSDFETELAKIWIDTPEPIHAFMNAKTPEEIGQEFLSLAGSESLAEFTKINIILIDLWYKAEIEFSGSLIRGFDYYDWIIFEMFDTNTENPRALFWGGRYNGLANIFGVKDGISAIWFAPWDETMKLFLEGHGLMDTVHSKQEEKYYLPLIEADLFSDIQVLAQDLRWQWKNVLLWLSPKKLQKTLKFAEKKWFSHVVILGTSEKEAWEYVVKQLQNGVEKRIKL